MLVSLRIAGLVTLASIAWNPASAQPIGHTAEIECAQCITDIYPRWSQMQPAELQQQYRDHIVSVKKDLSSFLQLQPKEMTFANTIAYIAEFDSMENDPVRFLFLKRFTSTSPELDRIIEECSADYESYIAWLAGESGVWNQLQVAFSQQWMKDITDSERFLLDQVITLLKESGAHLSATDRMKLSDIAVRLTSLELKFMSRLQKAVEESYLVIESKWDLFGLRDWELDYFQKLAHERGYDGKWLIPLQDINQFYLVMQACHVEKTRKKLWEKYVSIAAPSMPYDNSAIVEEILFLRHQKAQLLGYDHYADFVCDQMMLKSGDEAMRFIDSLLTQFQPHWDASKKKMLSLASNLTARTVSEINPWDEYYYLNQLESNHAHQIWNVDMDIFPYSETLDKTLRLFEDLFNVSITSVPSAYVGEGETLPKDHVEVWHPSVTVYSVHDKKTKVHLGSFYLDLFVRDKKNTGSFTYPLRECTSPTRKGSLPHLAVLMMNMPSPQYGAENYMLDNYYLGILLHEFGHVFHQMFSDADYQIFTMQGLSQDFIEFPSTLFEQWAKSPESLKYFASSSSMDDEELTQVLERLLESGKIRQMWNNVDTLIKAKLDLDVHMNYASHYEAKDLNEASYALTSQYTMPYSCAPPSALWQFGHIMSSGYEASFYSYILADVLAHDAFSRFRSEGFFSPKLWQQFRKSVLEPAASKEMLDMYHDFMGRDLKNDAFLKQFNQK